MSGNPTSSPSLFSTDMASDISYRADLHGGGMFVTSTFFEDDRLAGTTVYGPMVRIGEDEARRLCNELWGQPTTSFQEGEVFEVIADDVQMILAVIDGEFHRGIDAEAT